jgi:hypothetical protein
MPASPPRLDLDSLGRERERQREKERERERDLGVFDPLAGLNADGEDDEDDRPAKKRRVMPKIDGERCVLVATLPSGTLVIEAHLE